MEQKRYYFDTCIWIDFYDKRGRNGKLANRLIEKIVSQNHIIVYSEIIGREMKKLGFSSYEINQMFGMAKSNLIQVYSTREQVKEAKRVFKQRKIPFTDVLHAILTRDHEAQLVSRDRDFEKIKDITVAISPEKLI